VQLTTGCLCCLGQDELGQTLDDLFRKRGRGEVTRFNRVVIETSGLADPVPIVQSLIRHPALIDHYSLERVVTTVDVLTAGDVINREAEFARQVALADNIILTKTDVAGPASRSLLQALRGLNQQAPLSDRWEHGDEHLLNQIINSEKPRLDIDTPISPSARENIRTVEPHHLDRIQAVCVVRDEAISAMALTLFLEALAEHFGLELLRLKGLLRRSRLVLLGRKLSAPLIERLLDSIIDEVDDVQATLRLHPEAHGNVPAAAPRCPGKSTPALTG